MSNKGIEEVRVPKIRYFGPRDRRVSPLSSQYSVDPEKWPSHLPQLNEEGSRSFRMGVYDAFLILMPIGLIIKTVLCCIQKSPSIGYLPGFLSRFNDQVCRPPESIRRSHTCLPFDQFVTVFTIVFVTIMATLMKRLVLYRAQRGESVAKLEQYQASTSFTSTFKVIWFLRAFTFTSLGLITVWSFYYLGSQAILREYRMTLSEPLHNFPIYTPDFSKASIFQSEVPEDKLALVNGQFVGDLVLDDALTNNPHDVAGYPLVPNLQQYTSSSDSNGWSSTKSRTYRTSYQGLPQISQYEGQLIGSYETTTSYFSINCDKLALSQSPVVNMSTTQDLVFAPTSNSTDKSPRTFFLYYNSGGSVFQSTCKTTTVTLDIKVNCNVKNACSVTDFRSHNDTINNNNTQHPSAPFDDSNLFTTFLHNLGLASGLPADNSTSSILQHFLWNSLVPRGSSVRVMNLTQVVPNDLSVRLTQAINTYYTASLLYGAAASPHLPTAGELSTNFVQATMKGAQYDPQYRIDVAWIVVDFVACTILLAAAVVAAVLRSRTRAPDVFGYVSSFVRDNPNVPMPSMGSRMNGFHRARAMKDVKVRVAAPEPMNGEVQRIDSMAPGVSEVQRAYLQQKRYDSQGEIGVALSI